MYMCCVFLDFTCNFTFHHTIKFNSTIWCSKALSKLMDFLLVSLILLLGYPMIPDYNPHPTPFYGRLDFVGSIINILRLQMSCHRLLQRGFAHLYSYNIAKPNVDDSDGGEKSSLTEYANSALVAENAKDLHYKMKGASG